MATQILNLPQLSLQVLVGNNEDWIDSWSYVDGSGNALSLAGITLAMQLRILPTSLSPSLTVTPTASGNILTIFVAKSTLAALAPGSYAFEVQGQGDGYTRTIATGVVNVVQGVLR